MRVGGRAMRLEGRATGLNGLTMAVSGTAMLVEAGTTSPPRRATGLERASTEPELASTPVAAATVGLGEASEVVGGASTVVRRGTIDRGGGAHRSGPPTPGLKSREVVVPRRAAWATGGAMVVVGRTVVVGWGATGVRHGSRYALGAGLPGGDPAKGAGRFGGGLAQPN